MVFALARFLFSASHISASLLGLQSGRSGEWHPLTAGTEVIVESSLGASVTMTGV